MVFDKIICLMGPTASGKTNFALQLANHLPIEIISVDSALVYQGMDIGTSKPTVEELKAVPHHLIDIRDPSKIYSAAEFREDALKLIDEIVERGKIPVLVGGTGLYFQSLQFGLSPLPSANPEIRVQLLEESKRLGWKKMHEKLVQIDSLAANRIHPNDPQRIQRALEVYLITGKPMTSFFNYSLKNLDARIPMILSTRKRDYKMLSFALMPSSRSALHEKIEKRFHKMIEEGLIAEVSRLYARSDLHFNLPSMRAVGYRQVWRYLAEEYNFSEMIRLSVTATRQLAKRQITWLRRLQNIIMIENNHSDSLKSVINCVT